MEENKKEIDVLTKKRPTVNELKTEIIRLRKDLDKSNDDLNNSINKCSKLVTINNFLEANDKALKNDIASLEIKLDKANKDCKEFKARNQYSSFAFVITAIISLGAVITMILRLV